MTIEKTAEFVASRGAAVENKIREHEKSNPKFSFLHEDDPLHSYYVGIVEQARAKKAKEEQPSSQTESGEDKKVQEEKTKTEKKVQSLKKEL